jgi:flagellin-like protein
MHKRGLSGVITTLIMVLLVLAAATIVWTVVSNILNQTVEGISLSSLTLDLKISKVTVYEGNNTIEVVVERKKGKGKISGILIIASTGEDSESFSFNETINELGRKKFSLELLSLNPSEITSISIAPIVTIDSGKEKILDVLDEEEIIKQENVSSGGDSFNYEDYVLGLNPLTWYKLDGDILDYVNNNDGINNGAVYTASGKYDGAYNFLGGDYINVGGIGNRATFTWEFWMKSTQNDGSSAYYNSVVMFGTVQGSGDTNDALLLNHYGKLAWYDEIGGGSYNTGVTINDGEWHHIVVTKSGGTLTFYKDGASVGTRGTGSGSIKSGNLEIAKANWNTNKYYIGTIDEFRIWNKALNASEIQKIYSGSQN